MKSITVNITRMVIETFTVESETQEGAMQQCLAADFNQKPEATTSNVQALVVNEEDNG